MASILIIDDDKDFSGIIAEFLTKQGFEASWVGSAEEAYDTLVGHAFDAVLLDINLPGDSGFEVCENIRMRSNVPILFASARTSVDDEVNALEIGGDDYLAKPYSLKELLAHLKALLRRAGNSSESGIVTVGPLAINLSARTVEKSGCSIALSPKEFDVLACLAKRRGEAVPTDAILADAWGAFSEVEPSSVSVHIRWLREKLEDDPGKPTLIRTVRRVGYLLDAGGESS